MSNFSIQAVVFDLDDTLISRKAAFAELVVDWVQELEVSNSSDLIEDILVRDEGGNSDRNRFYLYLEELGISPGNANGIRLRFTRELPKYIEPDTTVHELLIRLCARNLELAVLTNGSSEMQRAKLRSADLARFFDPSKILISGEIGHDKPAVEAFTILAEKLETPPANTLFVGDHLENDIAGAAACGFQTCWKSSIRLDKKIEQPLFDFGLSSLKELEATCLS